jgi:DNA-binding NtrC family response regulator
VSVLVHTGDGSLRAAMLACVRRAGRPAEAPAASALAQRLAAGDARVLVLDLAAPDAERALAAARHAASPPALVALVADASPEALVAALRAGACQLLRKPFRSVELERALALAARPAAARLDAPPLVAAAPLTRALASRLEALAATELSVALFGEPGTGKTRIARWLHARGARRGGPFVEMQCAALEPAEAERALFDGPEAAGGLRIANAWGGTLVLDEPAALPPALQARLLPLLEAGGAPLPLRLVTTSRVPLSEQAACGALLPDLADRLGVVEVAVPPLRARRADVPVLARELAALAAAAAGVEPPLLDEEALAALARSELRGNVRQLETLMQRATLLFPGRAVDAAFFERPAGEALALASPEPRSLSLRELERAAIARALEVSQGNRTRAAQALGISVRTLRNKLRARPAAS